MFNKCSICKKGELEHDDVDIGEGRMIIRVICSSCEWIGYEFYEIQFHHLEDLNGNKIKEEDK